MAVIARFYVAEVTKFANGGYAEPKPVGNVVMRPVTRGEPNRQWASSTPSGEFKMTVIGEAFPFFEENLGKEIEILLRKPDGD